MVMLLIKSNGFFIHINRVYFFIAVRSEYVDLMYLCIIDLMNLEASTPFICVNSSPGSTSRRNDLSIYTLIPPSTTLALNSKPQKSTVYICSILFNFILLWSSSSILPIISISQKYPFISVVYTYYITVYWKCFRLSTIDLPFNLLKIDLLLISMIYYKSAQTKVLQLKLSKWSSDVSYLLFLYRNASTSTKILSLSFDFLFIYTI